MENSEILSALSYPLIVDHFGNLLALMDDGATVWVHVRNEALPSWGDWYVAVHHERKLSWVAGKKNLNLMINCCEYFVVPCADFDKVGEISSIPAYNSVFSMNIEDSRNIVIWNGSRGIGGFLSDSGAIGQSIEIPGMMAFDGWIDGDKIIIIGMGQRRIVKSMLCQYGHPAHAVIDLSKNSVNINKDKCNIRTKCPTILKASVKDSTVPWEMGIEVEYWLGRIGFPDNFYILGAVNDVRLSGHPDEEAMGVYPAVDEVCGLVLFKWENGQISETLACCLPGYCCFSVVNGKNEFWGYVGANGESLGINAIGRLSLNNSGDLGIQPLNVDWKNYIPPIDSIVASFRVFNFDELGYFAMVCFMGKGRKPYNQVLLKSNDGLFWEFLHEVSPDRIL